MGIEKITVDLINDLSLSQKLANIQRELKAPKNAFNKFGNYYYRSCEDILEAVKPLLAKYGLVMILSDEIQQIGARYYIKASAALEDVITGGRIVNTAYARETETKSGMDAAQITGAASSYARKIALSGLLLLDDMKDADDTNDKPNGKPLKKTAEKAINKTAAASAAPAEEKASADQIAKLLEVVQDVPAMLKYYRVDKIEDMTAKHAADTISRLTKEAK